MRKRSAAVLLILSLLVLAGCRVAPAGEAGVSASPAPTPSPVPLASPTPSPAPPPPVSEPPAPEEEDEEESGETILPVPEDTGEEARYQFALDWCENHKSEFSNADLYAMDRSYWFADYAPGVTAVSYGPLNAYYYEDVSGSMTPAEAVDALRTQMGACFDVNEPLDWAAMTAELAAQAAAGTADDGETERFLTEHLADAPNYYPGIGEDMWALGTATTGSGTVGRLVLMKQGNLYRMQWDGEFAQFAGLPEVQVRIAFDKALEAYHWFGFMTLPYDTERAVLQPDWEGVEWYAVDYPGISTMLELRTYLKTLFSDEVADVLLDPDFYREIDGVLYERPMDGGYPVPADMTASVRRESDTRLVYHLEGTLSFQNEVFGPVALDFPYEQVGDKWVFTEFSWPG